MARSTFRGRSDRIVQATRGSEFRSCRGDLIGDPDEDAPAARSTKTQTRREAAAVAMTVSTGTTWS